MRDRLERCVLLPFSLGCISESSVVVRRPDCHIKRSSHPQLSPYHLTTPTSLSLSLSLSIYLYLCQPVILENLIFLVLFMQGPKKGGRKRTTKKKMMMMKMCSHCPGFRDSLRISRTSLSYSIMDGGGGMEIGFPTDVKHVTHIGFDGAATSILSVNWRQPTADVDVDLFSTGNDSPHPPPPVAMEAAPAGTAA